MILYRNLLGDLLKQPLDRENLLKLEGITGLTPGDFKVVRDKFRFHSWDEINHKLLIDALRSEVAHKDRNSGKDKE